ncbi:MAG: energy transducer TonB, partial [Blastocatellia bacterium]
ADAADQRGSDGKKSATIRCIRVIRVPINPFHRLFVFLLFISYFCLYFGLPIGAVRAQTPIRLAVVELAGDEAGEFASLLRRSAREHSSFELPIELMDEQMVRAAAQGAGYAGSLNLSREEARALGQSLGCDYYLLGKIQSTRRLESDDQFHYEALAGIFLVETRTGRLIHFAFERATAKGEPDARGRLKELIVEGWEQYAAALMAARRQHQAEIANPAPPSGPLIEISPEATAGAQPTFYERLKPAYTEQAEMAGIAATVELEAVFEAGGEAGGRVGEIEVVRWAGFGLDESAIATLRQLRFKPAQLAPPNGKVITIRGLVRYNFRRPQRQADRPMDPSEIERLKRTLRDIKSAGSIPGQRPDN